MDKHRLELFSDGVFAIILTLMVLELKSPDRQDIGAFRELAPSLLVHALAFFQVGSLWVGHNRIFGNLHLVSIDAMWLNLLGLFWATLLPLGARLATEHPLEPLGASIQLVSVGFFYLSMLGLHPFRSPQGIQPTPAEVTVRNRRYRYALMNIAAVFSGALLCWITPLIGYAIILVTLIGNIRVQSISAELSRFEEDADQLAS